MELMGPNVSTFSPVLSLVKLIWLADMKLFIGDRTTVLSMEKSNTTRGNPPSMSPYTPVLGDHTPYLRSLATVSVCVCVCVCVCVGVGVCVWVCVWVCVHECICTYITHGAVLGAEVVED